jgi:PAS domain S-box-containing protein
MGLVSEPDATLTETLQLNRFKRPVWVFDVEAWRMLAANEAAVRLWGRSSLEELLGDDFSDRSPAVAERLRGYLRRFRAGETVEEDWTFYPSSGPVAARCLCSGLGDPDYPSAMLVEATALHANVAEGVARALEAMRHAGSAIGMFGFDGRLIVSNAAADTLLGLREDDPTALAELFADPKHGQAAVAWAAGGAIFDDEAVLRTPMGDRWFAVRIHPAHDPATGERAFVVSAADINERRKTEQRLTESERARAASERQARETAVAQRRAAEAERILRDAIESLDQGFLLVDRDDRIMMANRNYLELYPQLADYLQPGVPFRDLARRYAELEGLQAEGSLDAWVDWRVRQMRAGSPHVTEQTIGDGRTFLINESETPSGMVVSLRTDITPLKRVQAELRERVQAIEAANDGIAITDSGGRFVFMNRAHATLFGGRPEDFLGQTWKTLYEPAHARRLEEEIMPVVGASGTWRGELEGRKLNGAPVQQEISLSLLENGGLLCVTRDISDRRAAEAERVRLQQQLFQSQKMDSLGRLAGGIAHDFNNILASMLGYASFLEEDLPKGSEEARYAGAIVAAGKRAKDLIAQILAFGRPAELKRVPVAVDEVVAETVQLLASTLPPSIELAREYQDDDLAVAGDRSQLTQIVMNLAVNARDAMGEAPGQIVFSLRRCRPDWPKRQSVEEAGIADTELHLRRMKDGTAQLWLGRPPEDTEMIEIAVSDTGSGMSLEVMQSIFEPFFTTKKRGQGTGLGLAAVHGLVVSHGGAIAVESKIGTGTCFRIFLPAVTPAPKTVAPAPAEADGQNRRILVVDDEEAVRSMLVTGLTRRGFDPLQAADGPAALELLERETVDAVISDQTMPGMSGMDLMQAIHAERPDLPVVLCTGYSETLDAAAAAQAGAAAFLRKPISSDALIEVLQPLLPEAKT